MTRWFIFSRDRTNDSERYNALLIDVADAETADDACERIAAARATHADTLTAIAIKELADVCQYFGDMPPRHVETNLQELEERHNARDEGKAQARPHAIGAIHR